MDALIDKELFYPEEGSFLEAKGRRKRRKRDMKELKMNRKEYKDYQNKVSQVEALYPKSKDITLIKFYIGKLKELENQYRQTAITTTNASVRKQNQALLNFVISLIEEKEDDLVELEAKTPTTGGGTPPAPPAPPTPPTPPTPPAPPAPPAPPTGGGDEVGGGDESGEGLGDDKKGINKNLLIYGGIGVVALLVLYKFTRK